MGIEIGEAEEFARKDLIEKLLKKIVVSPYYYSEKKTLNQNKRGERIYIKSELLFLQQEQAQIEGINVAELINRKLREHDMFVSELIEVVNGNRKRE